MTSSVTKKKEKEKERQMAAAAAATAPSSPSPTTTGETIPLRSTGATDSVAIPREVAGAELMSSLQTSTLPREVESAAFERTITTPAPMVLTADDDDLPATLPIIPVVDHGAASTAVLASPTPSTVVEDTTVADMQLILDGHNVHITDAELLANIKKQYVDPFIEHVPDNELMETIENHVSRSEQLKNKYGPTVLKQISASMLANARTRIDMRTDNNVYDHWVDHMPAQDPYELVQRMEHLERTQTEYQNRQEVGTALVQSVCDNVANLEQRFTRVQDGAQKFEKSYIDKGKQKEVAECSRRTKDDDSSPDDHHPRGGVPGSPTPMLKGVTLPHTHEIVHFSQRDAGIKGHPSIIPGLPPWHAAVSDTFRVRTGASISDNSVPSTGLFAYPANTAGFVANPANTAVFAGFSANITVIATMRAMGSESA